MSEKPAVVQFVTGHTERYEHVGTGGDNGFIICRNDGEQPRLFPRERVHVIMRDYEKFNDGVLRSSESADTIKIE